MLKQAAAVLITSIGVVFSAEQFPFPQERDFAGCIKPDTVSQEGMNADITEIYDHYRDSYLRESSNTARGYYIEAKGNGEGGDASSTISEAHGYGMIIFALMAGYDANAREYFDGMFRFYKDHPSESNQYTMSWVVDAYESESASSSASDGDMDIAYGLILAHYQWGSDGEIDYRSEAERLIQYGIKEYDMGYYSKRVLLGDWDSDEYTTRSSDWMAGHLRAYNTITEDPFWNAAADTIYSLIDAVSSQYSPTTGLMPDFIAGSDPYPDHEGGGTGEENADKYYWNACRFPWRIATDYAHNGTPEAKESLNKILDWLESETGSDPSNIVSGYDLDGTPISNYSSVGFQAPFASACIVDSSHQNLLNNLWMTIHNEQGRDEYNTALNLLNMLLISGNWWAPGGEVTPKTEFDLTITNAGGSGTYTVGDEITLAANQCPAGWSFKKWGGDTEYVSSPADSVITFSMPDENVFLTAFYEDPQLNVDTANLSDNFIQTGSWSVDADLNGSEITFDTSQSGTATLSMNLLEDSYDGYSWLKGAVSVPGDYTDVNYIVLTYRSDAPLKLVLDQQELYESGTSHYYDLPAAAGDTTLLLQPSEFIQPDWTGGENMKDLPDMEDVISVSFEAIEQGAVTEITVSDLRLNCFAPRTTPIVSTGTANTVGNTALQYSGNTLSLADGTPAQFTLLSAKGVKVYQNTRPVSAVHLGDMNVSRGVYIAVARTAKATVYTKIMVK
ncbi:MAG: glycosyl hydrolase family 8 [Fibrobacterota bacterium]